MGRGVATVGSIGNCYKALFKHNCEYGLSPSKVKNLRTQEQKIKENTCQTEK